MARLRHRFGVRAWHLALAVLLTAPLLARAHTHQGEVAKPAACAVCVVTQHSPALASVPASHGAPAVHATRIDATPLAIPGVRIVRFHDGRGPPSPLSMRFA